MKTIIVRLFVSRFPMTVLDDLKGNTRDGGGRSK